MTQRVPSQLLTQRNGNTCTQTGNNSSFQPANAHKRQCRNPVERYSSVRRIQLLTPATHCLESNTMSAGSQTHRTTYYRIPHQTAEQANHRDRKQIGGCQRSRNGTDCKGVQENLWRQQRCSRSWLLWHLHYSKYLSIVRLKTMNLTVCQLCLHKARSTLPLGHTWTSCSFSTPSHQHFPIWLTPMQPASVSYFPRHCTPHTSSLIFLKHGLTKPSAFSQFSTV